MLYRNIAGQGLYLYAHDTLLNQPKLGDAANITGVLSKDGGVGIPFTHNVNETINGLYWQPLTQEETDAAAFAASWTSTTANVQIDPVIGYTEVSTAPSYIHPVKTTTPPWIKQSGSVIVEPLPGRAAKMYASQFSKAHDKLIIQPFSITNIEWDGVSKIVHAWMINTARPLAIVALPAKPSSANFVPVLSWKISEGVAMRYKLWNDVGEYLYVPLYRYQRIPQTFKLEIWNTKDKTLATLAESIQLLTSLLSLPTKYCGDEASQAMYTMSDCISGIIPLPPEESIDPGLGDYWIRPDCEDAVFVNVADPEPVEPPPPPPDDLYLLVEEFEA
jgi:hypothetical protein